MTIKQAAVIVLVVGFAVLIAAGVLAVVNHKKFKEWTHREVKVFLATLQTQNDGYGIFLEIEDPADAKKTKKIEPASFDGAYHKVAARIDELNRVKKISIMINPDKPDEIMTGDEMSIDNYMLPFVLACVGGFILFVGMILLMAVYSKLMFYFFLVGGIISVLCAGPVLVRSIQRQNWPSVTAAIDEVDYVYKVNNKGYSTYAPRAFLVYQVKGETFRSVDIGSYSGGSDIKQTINRKMKELKAKGSMKIRYNPKNPYEISRGPAILFILLPIGIGAIFIGCAWIIRKLVLK